MNAVKFWYLLFPFGLIINYVKCQKEVYIGGMFPTLPNKANVPGILLEVGTNLALEHINNDSSVLQGYTLKMIKADSKCDPKVSFGSLVDLLDNLPNKLVIYGAACSDATAFLAGLTNMASVVQVTHTSTSITLSGLHYPSLYRAIVTDFPAIKASLVLLKTFNWTRVAIMGENTPSGLLRDSYNFLINELNESKINIVWNKIITSGEIEDSISEIKEKDVRIILTIVSAKFGRDLMSKIFNAGVYGPSYVWIYLETYPTLWWLGTNNTKNEMLKKVIHYSFGFGDNLNVLDETTKTITGRTPRQIWLEYLDRLNMKNIPALAAYSYDGAWFIAKALDSLAKHDQIKLEEIKTGNETFYHLLKAKMTNISFSGLTGEFQIFNEETRERVDGEVHIYQYDQDGNVVEVMSYDLLHNEAELKTKKGYLWKDKSHIPVDREVVVIKAELPEESIFILLTALCAVSIFISVAFICYLLFCLVARKNGRHSATLNIFIAMGCICLCTAGILFGLRIMDTFDNVNQAENSCISQLALASIGITLVFGGTISKLFGILRIVDGLHSKAVLCGTMLLPLLLFLFTDVVLVTLWLNENTPQSVKILYDEDTSLVTTPREARTLKYNVFCTTVQYPDWLITIYIFHSVQAITSFILAISTRGKSSQQIDDGVSTRCSVLFMVFLLLGDIFSNFPSRHSILSLFKSYVIFTSVVCGSTLIILFLLFPLMICRNSCNKYSVATSSGVRLTDIRKNPR